MRDILKNIICLLIINIIASIGSFAIILLVIAMFEPSDNIISKIFYDFSFQIIFLIVIGRLLILPFAYKKLENSANYKLVSKFIHKLKQSNYLKLIVLVIAYFIFWPLGCPWFGSGFYGQLIQSVLLGLVGNYLVLYIYWFIEDKIKNRIKNNKF